jgi:hypothetical protein
VSDVPYRHPFDVEPKVMKHWKSDRLGSVGEMSLVELESKIAGREVVGGPYFRWCHWIEGNPKQYYAFVLK